MNNRGQVLIIFVLLLPILFLILAFLVEIGDLLVYQNKLESNVRYIAEYGAEHLEDTNLKNKLETLNIKNLDGKAKITIDEKSVKVYIKQRKKNIFNFVSIPLNIEFTYVGETKDGKVTLKKE